MKCKDCRYWQDNKAKKHNTGQCRYKPPIFDTKYSGVQGLWPQVSVNDWCGKYEKSIGTIKIGELRLSYRAKKVLLHHKITTLAQLVEKTSEDLLRLRNFGLISLREVRRKLADNSLILRND